jgi:dUTP pyrophosphatase
MKFEKVSRETYAKAFSSITYGRKIYEDFIVDSTYDSIILPKRSTAGSAGYDFYFPYGLTIPSHSTIIIPTGIKVKLDKDKVLMIAPRSSFGLKYRMKLTNTQAYIDSDYYNNESNEGHILIGITSENDKDIEFKAGEKFAQGIIIQYFTTEDDNTTAVRTGGIGSTGK